MQSDHDIVGITGTLGAGKGTIVEYLKTKGYIHLSVREYLISELQKRNLEINRDNLRELANNLSVIYKEEKKEKVIKKTLLINN